MNRSRPSLSAPFQPGNERRSSSTWVALIVGVPLAAAILCLIHFGPLRHSQARRYVSHPVECVEVILFCCAISALGAKLIRSRGEQAAGGTDILPPWDGRAVSATEASQLLAEVNRLPYHLQDTFLVRRVGGLLGFVAGRGSAKDLDDQLRSLADSDALALEGSYGLIRFITWAIPILGFLGTVLGITQAISGVTPEVLEHSLSTVTDGLALAFDTTALGLGLTMITMFCTFVVERAEQAVLEAVDRYADAQLAHRFERTDSEGGQFLDVLRQNTGVLLQATEQLVQRQADLWSETLERAERRRAEGETGAQQRLTAALEAALERTLETHAQRLAALEKQAADQSLGLVDRIATLAAAVRETGREHQAALVKISQNLGEQTEALIRLQEGEKELVRLQDLLSQNLTALAGAGQFDQAVQSLTAAIHLLTTRLMAGRPAESRPVSPELKSGNVLTGGPRAAA